MEIIILSREEFEEFRDVQIRPRADWPATFSCNKSHEVWPFHNFGPTGWKIYLDGQIPRLDEIVRIVLNDRSEGGRFFVNDNGVFVKLNRDDIQQIARFIVL